MIIPFILVLFNFIGTILNINGFLCIYTKLFILFSYTTLFGFLSILCGILKTIKKLLKIFGYYNFYLYICDKFVTKVVTV